MSANGDAELVFQPARGLIGLMTSRQLSARELLDAHLQQIEKVNPQVNALVTVCADRACELAAAADAALAKGRVLGPLHGLPAAHKDLADTAGIRTTYGSPLHADHVPTRNHLVVQRMLDAGCVTLGKTNTPEFGTGSQTYNPVFGATANAYDPAKTCGGSSGGAAVALATGMAAVCDGSDMAGSLRNPASWNNVVGLRPSDGRVPQWPNDRPVFTLSVYGPMGRTVGDVALQMLVMARPSNRSILNLPPQDFHAVYDGDMTGTPVAWSDTLDGLPIDPALAEALAPARGLLTQLGCAVTDAEPDLTGVDEAFDIMRAAYYWQEHAQEYRDRPDQLGDSVRWEIEHGSRLTVEDLGRAETLRARAYDRMHDFLDTYRFLVAPVTQLPPFPIEQHWPETVAGVPQTYYREWMRVCSRISLTGNPAVSVPFGFTADGLPAGLQIIGRHGDDLGVLQLAQAVESATGTWRTRPARPVVGRDHRPPPAVAP
ncbi:amidase [Streptomyces sp. NPDC093586]|uniref:amidase n=1 Tax=Streptomyces sp. NPDC093586 TaxID=3366042 RepID=UPI003810279C